MSRRNVHIVPSGSSWLVKLEGVATPVSTHRTQAAADRAGRPIARQNEVEIVIHGRDGRIRDKDSFGADPNPPTDARH